MNYRPIEKAFIGPKPHMVGDGFRVSQYFPSGYNNQERLSPFLLLDYHAPFYYQPSEIPRGVGAHPHRGFETVTISYQGKIEHHDNKGNHGIIGPGDVQWMTASSGILHKEYHEHEFSRAGGTLHMIQLWVNLPKKDKWSTPKYQAILKEEMGQFVLPNNYGEISVLAGEAMGVKGSASTFSPMNIYNVYLNKDGEITLNEHPKWNTMILVLKGNIKVNEELTVPESGFVLFENKDGDMHIKSNEEDTIFITLSGQSLDEPIASYGPFVMNTMEEIHEAYADYRSGKFGSHNF